ncbi:MAG: hypothetical protein KKD29_07380 [Candidatus Omnitrophica bacterium]|nr:hypothetical protein [Candidatus Omnitrophota bacterium]MBU4487598.1 hypothetical protein [Candidatus Omnitrophota bacterium]MCG2705082.1 hypothetical protein [Candidatus Omnitrophota bacterium]
MMRKMAIFVVTLAFMVSLTQTASAGMRYGSSDTSSEVITGTVLFMSTNSLTVKDNKTRTNRTVDIRSDLMSGLEEGDKVKIVLQKNSNLAEKVIKLKSRSKNK